MEISSWPLEFNQDLQLYSEIISLCLKAREAFPSLTVHLLYFKARDFHFHCRVQTLEDALVGIMT
jgi:hypothetical protein